LVAARSGCTVAAPHRRSHHAVHLGPPSRPARSVALVPEIEVSDFARSLHFYVAVIGFTVLYDRPERPFAYLTLGAAHIMIEHGGSWMTGPLETPFGRGLNLQIDVPDVAALAERLAARSWPLFRPIEDAWYRRGTELIGARECVVQDPDGYLLRFAQRLGIRQTPLTPPAAASPPDPTPSPRRCGSPDHPG